MPFNFELLSLSKLVALNHRCYVLEEWLCVGRKSIFFVKRAKANVSSNLRTGSLVVNMQMLSCVDFSAFTVSHLGRRLRKSSVHRVDRILLCRTLKYAPPERDWVEDDLSQVWTLGLLSIVMVCERVQGAAEVLVDALIGVGIFQDFREL